MKAKLIFDLIADELPRLNNLSLQRAGIPATANTAAPGTFPASIGFLSADQQFSLCDKTVTNAARSIRYCLLSDAAEPARVSAAFGLEAQPELPGTGGWLQEGPAVGQSQSCALRELLGNINKKQAGAATAAISWENSPCARYFICWGS
jgi:hypothetical protein